MKLKFYNQTTSRRLPKAGEATVRINTETGGISFSKKAAEVMGLKPASKIEVIQDEESPKDWYIMKSKSPDAFAMRNKTMEKGNAFIIQSVSLAKEIFKSCTIDACSAGFLIAQNPIENPAGGGGEPLYAIITKSANTVKRENTKKSK